MDPYVYPGTNVLKNLWEVRELDQLSKIEGTATSRRLAELYKQPVPGQFDGAHLQSIHRYIFQDVYEWAGQFRTVNIARADQFYFAFAEQIIPSLDRLLGELAREKHLASTDSARFCNRAAYYMGELNAVHPFRDGNGRTQREFIRQLGLRGGHSLNWSRVTREHMYEASHRSFKSADHTGLEQVLLQALGA